MSSHPPTSFYFKTKEHYIASIDCMNGNNTYYFASTKKLQEICPENCSVLLISMTAGTESLPEFEGYVVVEETEGVSTPRKFLDIPPVDYTDAFDAFQLSLDWGVDQLTTTDEEPEPEVEPNEVPVFAIPANNAHIYIGKDTDAFHVAKVSSVIHKIYVNVYERLTEVKHTRYHELELHGSAVTYPENVHPFDIGSTIVIWNARGIGNDFFLDNFIKICRAHMPKIVFVTEARVDMRTLKEVADRLSSKYSYEHFGRPEDGGVVLLWQKYHVNPVYGHKSLYDHFELAEIEFEAVYQQPGKRKMLPFRCSRPPDAQDDDDEVPNDRVIYDRFGDDPTCD